MTPKIPRPRFLRSGVCAGLGMGFLLGCGEWKVDSSELSARTTGPAPGLDCASCHGYPLADVNHDYHLFRAGSNKDLNGEITCLDCHSLSLQSQSLTLFDSVYEAPSGEKWRTLGHPNPGDTTSDGKVIRSLPLFAVDTLHQNRPIPMPPRPGAVPRFQEYMTAVAHMNKKVDVHFDNRNSLPARFNGDSASFNPAMETCSAVACHPGDKPYSWGSVAKGLPELKDDEEEEP
ncbi:MAG TPA: hypothetical protein VJ385_16335 [Fibrobacteria bacterium]|nr:hypothetical protein [Fibrobacteria bacterium]